MMRDISKAESNVCGVILGQWALAVGCQAERGRESEPSWIAVHGLGRDQRVVINGEVTLGNCATKARCH